MTMSKAIVVSGKSTKVERVKGYKGTTEKRSLLLVKMMEMEGRVRC